ncbi:hypothetical protein [Streptomyces triticiradicis]|uniref:hypothetical protein n=1 Tax=Streptomyces triticiradicis TaxID=2651189 RepID=UPI00298DF6A0|nr:hypothetical protein [Streptomyces triticiradicis]
MTLGSVRRVVPIPGSQSEDDVMGDEVYQPGGPDIREDEGILDPEDTLEDRGADPFDEGWSPPERPLAVDHRGTTAREQHEGESLDEKLAEERADPALREPDEDDGADGPTGDGDEFLEDEVDVDPEERILALDVGAHEDAEHDMIAEDVGVDGYADPEGRPAVHLLPDDIPERLLDEDLRRPPEDEVRRLRSETDSASSGP